VSHAIKEYFVRDATKECGKVWDFVSLYKANIAKVNAIIRSHFGNAMLILIERKQVREECEMQLILCRLSLCQILKIIAFIL
jgi:hypothetical protein